MEIDPLTGMPLGMPPGGDPMAMGGDPMAMGPPPMDPMAMGGDPMAGGDPLAALMGGDPAMGGGDPLAALAAAPPPGAMLGTDVEPVTEWVPAKGEVTSQEQCAAIGATAVSKGGGKDKCCTTLPPEEWDKSWKPLDELGGVMGETASGGESKSKSNGSSESSSNGNSYDKKAK